MTPKQARQIIAKIGGVKEFVRHLSERRNERWAAIHARRLLGELNIWRWHLLYRLDEDMDEEEYWLTAKVGKEFHTGLPRFLEWEAVA